MPALPSFVVTRLFLLSSWMLLASITKPVDGGKHNKPVKLFILAGEGNIEGFASIGHLRQLVFPKDPHSVEPQYQHLINNETGDWLQRDDVFVSYDHQRDKERLVGKLQLTQFGGDANSFGPELQMGHVLGDLYEEPVVIVKAGWKKRSLGKDFASPSTNHTGFQWYRLMTSIHETANSLHKILGPDYRYTKPDIGGLVWWQGYKDLSDVQLTKDYAQNLELFIRDIRNELKQPWLPVVVAELGGQGPNTTDPRELEFRAMQEKVIKEKFNFTPTEFVKTSPHVQTDMEIKDYTLYWGRADTMMEISQSFAMALADMDFKKNHDMTDEWFFEEADVSMSYYKTYFFFHFAFRIVAFGVLAFAAVAVFRDKFDYRRTWNTAVSRFRSLREGHLALDNCEADDDSDHDRDAEDGEENRSDRSIPELRDA